METIVNEALARVVGQLGSNHREAVYQRALAAELRSRGHVVALEVPVPINYVATDGFPHPVGTERADLVVDLKYVIELKVGTANGEPQASRYAQTLQLDAIVINIQRNGSFMVQCLA